MSTTRVLAAPGLGGWRDQWDELVLASPLPSPFLRSWWLEQVARRPLVLLVVEGERLLGGLALEVAGRFPVRRLRMAGGGTLAPDHLDVVARPGSCDLVVAALRDWWQAQRRTVLDLRGLSAAPMLAAVLPGASLEAEEVAPYEPVDGFDPWLAARSGSFRKRLRRLERQAQRHGVGFRAVGADEAPAALETLARLHAGRADRTALSREMSRLRPALEAGHAAGEVLVVVAESAGDCGMVGVAFITGGRLSLYQVARAPDPAYDGLGTLLDVALLEHGCRAGVHEVDFLRGAEPYKASFVAHERTLVRIRAARGSLARFVLALERALRTVRNRLRRSGPEADRPGAAPAG